MPGGGGVPVRGDLERPFLSAASRGSPWRKFWLDFEMSTDAAAGLVALEKIVAYHGSGLSTDVLEAVCLLMGEKRRHLDGATCSPPETPPR